MREKLVTTSFQIFKYLKDFLRNNNKSQQFAGTLDQVTTVVDADTFPFFSPVLKEMHQSF